MKPYELSVVMPVYNEAEAIGPVIAKWMAMLDTLGIRYRIRAYNDGSKDGTGAILKDTASRSGGRVAAIDKPNSGHGPTILRGYREAAEDSDWVFQIDSDDEMGPEAFPTLWAQREGYDFLVGRRDGRKQPLARKVVSLVSRLCVRVFYGKGIWDVNTPYRLMRAEVFAPFYAQIPDDTFAPNVILSGLVARHRLRHVEIPVPQHDRTTGEVSIRKWKLLKAAARSFAQTMRFALDSGAGARAERGLGGWLVRGLAGLGVIFAAFLLTTRANLAVLPLALPLLAVGVIALREARGVRWCVRHAWWALGILTALGLMARVAYAWLCSSLFANGEMAADYEILWTQAKTLAAGTWPVSKSLTSVCCYALAAKVLGPTCLAGFAMTLALSIGCFVLAFLIGRDVAGRLCGLLFAALLAFSPTLVFMAPSVATEHVYTFFLLLTIACVVRWHMCPRPGMGALYALLAGVCVWLTMWARGEGALMWVAIPLVMLLAKGVGACPWRKVLAGAGILLAVFAVGCWGALTFNRCQTGASTIFSSNDNLWPRLFGANAQTGGVWTLEDKLLILERYRHDHPDVRWAGAVPVTGGTLPRELAAKCPTELVPYIKEEIAARWRAMSLPELVGLLWHKARIVWRTPTGLNMPNHPRATRLAVSAPLWVFHAGVILVALCFFAGVCAKWLPGVPPAMWIGLVYLLGNAVLLCLTEAAPRYGYALNILIGLYPAYLLARLIEGPAATREAAPRA